MFFGRVFHSDGAAVLPETFCLNKRTDKLEDRQQEPVMYQKNEELNFTFNLKWYACVRS